jgi:hypothetical protein
VLHTLNVTNWHDRHSLFRVAGTLASRIDADRGDSSLDRMLHAVTETTDVDRIEVLGHAARALVRVGKRLNVDRTSHLLAGALDALERLSLCSRRA